MREFSPHGLLCSLKLACTCVPAAQHICQPLRAYSYPPCSHLMGRCRIIHDYGGTHILFWSLLHHCTTTSWAAGHERNPHYEVLFMLWKYIYIRLNTWFITSVWSLLFFYIPVIFYNLYIWDNHVSTSFGDSKWSNLSMNWDFTTAKLWF